MAYLPCNRPYGSCTPGYPNCLGGTRGYSGVSTPGGTKTYVANELKYGYEGPLSPRIYVDANTKLEWGSAPGTTTTAKILTEKHLMIAVPDGDATSYIYSQALSLEITVAPVDDDVKGPTYTGYVWRVLETEGPPPDDADLTFLDGTPTSFPGAVVIRLPNPDPNQSDTTREIALLHIRTQRGEDGGVEVHPTAPSAQPCWSRRQLRRACRCR